MLRRGIGVAQDFVGTAGGRRQFLERDGLAQRVEHRWLVHPAGGTCTAGKAPDRSRVMGVSPIERGEFVDWCGVAVEVDQRDLCSRWSRRSGRYR
jgi:hypothetical protein